VERGVPQQPQDLPPAAGNRGPLRFPLGFPRYPMDKSRELAFTRSVAAHLMSVSLRSLDYLDSLVRASLPCASTRKGLRRGRFQSIYNSASQTGSRIPDEGPQATSTHTEKSLVEPGRKIVHVRSRIPRLVQPDRSSSQIASYVLDKAPEGQWRYLSIAATDRGTCQVSSLSNPHITLHSRKSWLSTCISDCMSQDMPREVQRSLIQTRQLFGSNWGCTQWLCISLTCQADRTPTPRPTQSIHMTPARTLSGFWPGQNAVHVWQ